MLLLGALGWGLITMGAVTHVLYHARLTELLGVHVDRASWLSAMLTGLEVAIAVGLPIALVADAPAVDWIVTAAVVLGVGFAAWIGRLLATGSELPCACSLSSAPTSPWSLLRASLVVTTAAWWFRSDAATGVGDVVTLSVGLAAAAAVFLLPDALAWPEVSRAQLARIDSHIPVNGSQSASGR